MPDRANVGTVGIAGRIQNYGTLKLPLFLDPPRQPVPSHTHTHTHTPDRTHTHTRTHTGEESEGERKGVEVENIKMS